MPPDQRDERYQPLALISVTLIALLGFAVFFLSFLVAPLAILIIFYVGFAASDRSKRSNGNGGGQTPAAAPVVVEERTTTTYVQNGPAAPPGATPYPTGTSAEDRLAREAIARRERLERADMEMRGPGTLGSAAAAARRQAS